MKRIIRIGLVLLCLSVVVTACSPNAATMATNAQPYDVDYLLDIEYANINDESLLLDIYCPKGVTKNMPAIVYIHGGGFISGGKEGMLFPIGYEEFVKKGYIFVSINYRLAKNNETNYINFFPTQYVDSNCAIRFLRANAEKYHIDPDKIGVMGHSAGAMIASFLGTTNGISVFDGDNAWNTVSSDIQAVCVCSGSSDYPAMAELWPDLPLIGGGPISGNMELSRIASPITYVSKEDPPFLFLHGDADSTVPYEQAAKIYEKMKKEKLDVTLITLKGCGHSDYTDTELFQIIDFFSRVLPVK